MQTGMRDQYSAMSVISRNVLICSFLNYTSVSLCTLQFSVEITFNTPSCTQTHEFTCAHTRVSFVALCAQNTTESEKIDTDVNGERCCVPGQTDNQCVHNGSSETGCGRIHLPFPYSPLPSDKQDILSPKRSSKDAKITRKSPRITSDIWNYASRKSPGPIISICGTVT